VGITRLYLPACYLYAALKKCVNDHVVTSSMTAKNSQADRLLQESRLGVNAVSASAQPSELSLTITMLPNRSRP
jgi:hypothetical protein